MSSLPRVFAIALAAIGVAAPAVAASYPVTGLWTYDYSPAQGPAAVCNEPQMSFDGERRFDSGSGEPDYRNISVTTDGPGRYKVVDQVYNGQVRGHVDYTLSIIDDSHIALSFALGGETLLRRCE